jgi:hypothetical protein
VSGILSTETERQLMKLMPLWVLLIVFTAALIEAAYPGVDVFAKLSEPWVEMLFISIGLGGMPLAIVKRAISMKLAMKGIKGDGNVNP